MGEHAGHVCMTCWVHVPTPQPHMLAVTLKYSSASRCASSLSISSLTMGSRPGRSCNSQIHVASDALASSQCASTAVNDKAAAAGACRAGWLRAYLQGALVCHENALAANDLAALNLLRRPCAPSAVSLLNTQPSCMMYNTRAQPKRRRFSRICCANVTQGTDTHPEHCGAL